MVEVRLILVVRDPYKVNFLPRKSMTMEITWAPSKPFCHLRQGHVLWLIPCLLCCRKLLFIASMAEKPPQDPWGIVKDPENKVLRKITILSYTMTLHILQPVWSYNWGIWGFVIQKETSPNSDEISLTYTVMTLGQVGLKMCLDMTYCHVASPHSYELNEVEQHWLTFD